jgi:hypothetical protein
MTRQHIIVMRTLGGEWQVMGAAWNDTRRVLTDVTGARGSDYAGRL